MQARARLVQQHMDLLTRLVCGANDTQRRPEIDCGQRARVAVMQNREAILYERVAMRAHPRVDLDIVVGDFVCCCQQGIAQRAGTDMIAQIGDRAHRVYRPHQVDGRRTRRLEQLRRVAQVGAQAIQCFCVAGQCGQRHAVSGRCPDRGRAAHRHIGDRRRDGRNRPQIDRLQFPRQRTLIDQPYCAVYPIDSTHYVPSSETTSTPFSIIE